MWEEDVALRLAVKLEAGICFSSWVQSPIICQT